MSQPLTILGVMSGTSLDGVDLALCTFSNDGSTHEILRAETVAYTDEWKSKLRSAEHSSGHELIVYDREYGRFLGNLCRRFVGSDHVDYISSHGHTIFHEPKKGITFQLGSGAEIVASSGVNTVCDFRTTDVALGGQGAPLVPIGDRLLFGKYTYCLNLGGFANVSFEQDGKRIAFDIAPMNYVLNRIAQRLGKPFDDGGRIAAQGKFLDESGAALYALNYYKQAPPKSLSREWVEEHVFPLLSEDHAPEDILYTCCIHFAKQIALACPGEGTVLVTGGGVYNDFFMDALRTRCTAEVVIPSPQVIEFKEALIFALLGYLRVNGKINALASVTGAARDSCTGSIYLA